MGKSEADKMIAQSALHAREKLAQEMSCYEVKQSYMKYLQLSSRAIPAFEFACMQSVLLKCHKKAIRNFT